MRMMALVVAATLTAVLGLDLSPAEALSPSPDNGAELAARWCADCHMDQGRASPSFHAISVRRSAADIRSALARPHARPMGGIALNRREIDDVTAYILSLKR